MAARILTQIQLFGPMEFVIALEPEDIGERRDRVLDADHAFLAVDARRDLLHARDRAAHQMVRPDDCGDFPFAERLRRRRIIFRRDQDDRQPVVPLVQERENLVRA